MIITVRCLTCRKLVDKLATSRNLIRRGTDVDVWCHGHHQILFIGDGAKEITDRFELEAFRRPTLIVIDRDRGDEDPNEPIQGPSCQM